MIDNDFSLELRESVTTICVEMSDFDSVDYSDMALDLPELILLKQDMQYIMNVAELTLSKIRSRITELRGRNE